jgi:DNA-binding response OmpR family regulator
VTTATPLRVLIVEDERELGEVFQEYLVARGHVADLVSSAEAAVDVLRTRPPQAIVLDVKLPGLSGLDFMRLPLVREAGIPVIVVSGHASEDDARLCLQLGALEFLPKPVPLDILARVLEHARLFAEVPVGAPASGERRRASRLAVALPVRVVTEEGRSLRGVVAEVSATGLRARVEGPVEPGSAVRLSIAVPDGGPAVDAVALVIRTESNGDVAVWFLDVLPGETDRLLARGRPTKTR